MRKITLSIVVLFIFNIHLYAAHQFTDDEKIKIANNASIAIATVGKALAFDETAGKMINKHIVADVITYSLSRLDDQVIAKFLAISKSELIEKLGGAIAAYKTSNTLNFLKKYKSTKAFLKLNKYDLIFIVTDITVEFIKLDLLNDEAQKLLLELVYTDCKAYIKYRLGDPIGGGIDWALANGKALYKSTTGIYKLTKEFNKLNKSTFNLQHIHQIQDTYKTYLSAVTTESDANKKVAYLRGFVSTCEDSYTTKEFFKSFKNKDILHDFCINWKDKIVEFDKKKLEYLLARMTPANQLYSKKDANQYIDKYFPYSDREIYKNVLNTEVDANELKKKISIQNISYRYLMKAYKYGFDISNFISDSSYQYHTLDYIDTKQAVKIILDSKKLWFGGHVSKLEDVISSDQLKNFRVIRSKNLAYYLVNILKVDKYLSENEKKILRKKSNIIGDISYEELALRKLKIMESGTFYKNKLIKMHNFLVYWTNSMDYLTCGHLECSNYDIIKGLQHENK